ncbi:hypothetical protein BKA62DRAFT_676069 [Auriculariales sp. MPI-PUGE-AT-0066]|nr:hypothetical protein BKA62DRAFT_676069 [Auriculariales sp. MPI-PUGE-AT-0066]
MRALSAIIALALCAQARNLLLDEAGAALVRANCPATEVRQRGSFGYRRTAVFEAHAQDGCAHGVQETLVDNADYVEDDEVLYSLVPAGVHSAILGQDYDFAREVQRVVALANGQQLLLQADPYVAVAPVARLLRSDKDGALLALHPGKNSFLRLEGALQQVPYISLVALAEPLVNVGDNKVEIRHIEEVLANLTFSSDVATVVHSITSQSIRADVRYLSGEDKDSPIWSRHSFSDGALVAADWVLWKFEQAGGKCHLWKWGEGFAPDVVCSFEPAEGTDAEAPIYILGAHYDSRGSFGSTRAPGADDDGSGTSHILAIAKALHDNRVKLRSRLQIIAFSGEEQGLLGSRAYAAKLAAESAPVALMIQADMLAYRVPGESAQIGLPESITPRCSASWSATSARSTRRSSSSARRGFLESGFVATQVFERAGPIADPMYHNSGDLVEREGYDVDQIRSIAKSLWPQSCTPLVSRLRGDFYLEFERIHQFALTL